MTGTSNSNQPLSTRVIEAIASRKGVDPIDLDEPLYTVVDTEALDALFFPGRVDDSRTEGRVTFRYDEHVVTVFSDGRVEVFEADDPE